MALIIVLIMPVTEQTHITYGFLKSLFLNDQGQKMDHLKEMTPKSKWIFKKTIPLKTAQRRVRDKFPRWGLGGIVLKVFYFPNRDGQRYGTGT